MMLCHLVLCQLRLDFVWIIGNFHLGVQSLLRFVQPLHQFVPGFMELMEDKEANAALSILTKSYDFT